MLHGSWLGSALVLAAAGLQGCSSEAAAITPLVWTKVAGSGPNGSILGFGNQGEAQALNLRDSGLDVSVCVRADASRDQAVSDGFAAGEIADASGANVVCVLVPDDVDEGGSRCDDDGDERHGRKETSDATHADPPATADHDLAQERLHIHVDLRCLAGELVADPPLNRHRCPPPREEDRRVDDVRG